MTNRCNEGGADGLGNINRLNIDSINKQLKAAARASDTAKLAPLLLDPKCHALFKDNNGITALMWAAHKGHGACPCLPLPMSDPLATDSGGGNALMHAAYNGHASCVRRLLPLSDVLVKNDEEQTPANWTENLDMNPWQNLWMPTL